MNNPDYTRKYINQQILSMDDIAQNEKTCQLYGLCIVVQEDGFGRIEEESIRRWLMKTCNISAYELQICELIAAHGKYINSKSVKEILCSCTGASSLCRSDKRYLILR